MPWLNHYLAQSGIFWTHSRYLNLNPDRTEVGKPNSEPTLGAHLFAIKLL